MRQQQPDRPQTHDRQGGGSGGGESGFEGEHRVLLTKMLCTSDACAMLAEDAMLLLCMLPAGQHLRVARATLKKCAA
jgi:hypothetical protein